MEDARYQEPYDKEALAQRARSAVFDVVQQQIASGIDIVNDGELGKTNFSRYTRERISDFEERPPKPGFIPSKICNRNIANFPEYFEGLGEGTRGLHIRVFFCNAPLKYTGQAVLQADIDNFKAALQGVKVEEAFLPAVAPGTMEHWLKNDYYPNDEAYLFAIADTMHREYKTIVDARFTLQIDDPDLPDAWQIHSNMSLAEYRKYAGFRVDAIIHALRGIPEDRVRFHVCWGSYHGPHKYDIPLREIVDLILKIPVGAYSIEASNPRHEHEWWVWEDVKLPDGKILIPGVVSHVTDVVEHPELVAQRLVRFAKCVKKENITAGSDCGLGTRVGHPKIAWAKFEAMIEGARLATKELWGR
ncbi:MAG: epoxyalkane--coenzyme M transferase [Candidatus Binatia bacterium]|nr:epoxyalkane--coenzyme M transferase [Candidatus Binatia bacterium]